MQKITYILQKDKYIFPHASYKKNKCAEKAAQKARDEVVRSTMSVQYQKRVRAATNVIFQALHKELNVVKFGVVGLVDGANSAA